MGVALVPTTHEVPQNPHAECMLGSACAAADILNLLPLSDFFFLLCRIKLIKLS